MNDRYVHLSVIHPKTKKIVYINIKITSIGENTPVNNLDVFESIINPLILQFQKQNIPAGFIDTQIHHFRRESEYPNKINEVIKQITSEG